MLRCIALMLFLSICLPALGDWQLLPPSHHEQYLTYALFTDEQSGILWRNGRNAWGAIGGNFALLGNTTLSFNPELIVFATVNASWRENKNFIDFLTETFDARFGAAIEGKINDNWRLTIGVTHLSGHTSDSILDPTLVSPNLGYDQLVIRTIVDIDQMLRVGATLKPYIGTDPIKQAFAADEFVEWFPWTALDSTTKPSPYLAVGLEEDGIHQIGVNFHAQLGVYLGNHFSAEEHTALRLALGYYNGEDLRLKYAQFKNSTMSFYYGGVLLNW